LLVAHKTAHLLPKMETILVDVHKKSSQDWPIAGADVVVQSYILKLIKNDSMLWAMVTFYLEKRKDVKLTWLSFIKLVLLNLVKKKVEKKSW